MRLSIRTIYKTITALGLIATVIICIWAWNAGLFNSTDTISRVVKTAGVLGPILFIAIQVLQVIVPVIPGGVSLLAGVIIFGPVWGFIYNYIGIVVGSMIAFLMVRKMGRPFLQSVSSTKTFDKYIGWLDKGRRFETMFTVAILLPVAPDDFLCMLAGLTKMSFRKLTAILVICKPPTIIVYSLGLSTVVAWATSVLGY